MTPALPNSLSLAVSQSGSDAHSAAALHPESPVTAAAEFTILNPKPRWALRRLIAALSCAGILLSAAPGPVRLGLAVLVIFLAGTGVEIEVSDREIRRSHVWMFCYTRKRRWLNTDLREIEAEWDEDSGVGEALLLGLYGWCVAPLLEWLCPWSGGSYRLWMRTHSGKRRLLWQGRRERSFRRNQTELTRVTRLPLVRT